MNVMYESGEDIGEYRGGEGRARGLGEQEGEEVLEEMWGSRVKSEVGSL